MNYTALNSVTVSAMMAFTSSPFVPVEVGNFDAYAASDSYIEMPSTASDCLITASKDIKEQFARLAALWRNETGVHSMLHLRFSHPSYQTILAMGEKALPFIFDELRNRPDHWTVALAAITGVNPVRPNANFKQAVADWITWGNENGYA